MMEKKSTRWNVSLFNMAFIIESIMALTQTHFMATVGLPLTGFVEHVEYWQGTSVGRGVFVGNVLIGFIVLVVFGLELRLAASVERRLFIVAAIAVSLLLEIYWVWVALL